MLLRYRLVEACAICVLLINNEASGVFLLKSTVESTFHEKTDFYQIDCHFLQSFFCCCWSFCHEFR